ncbi:MAG: LruC domain-containing protein [Lentimicrobiaceae bacterium]|nr:LruC domain-containing protein [Lentimicrobiaceae bacterium]
MNLKTIAFLALSLFVMTSLPSCKKDSPGGVNPNGNTIFDFATKDAMNVNINYGIQGLAIDGKYQIQFDIYGENPFYIQNGYRFKKTNVTPLYSAWTDANGRFEGSLTLPLALTKVYLVSKSFGATNIAEVAINNGSIIFEAFPAITEKSATALTNDWTLPTKWYALGNWDANGTPDYLIENKTFTTDFLESVQTMFDGEEETGIPESSIWYKHPEFFIAQEGTRTDMDIHIIKPTGVTISVLAANAKYKSCVGYYVYKTTERPTSVEEIDSLYVAFPHTSEEDNLSAGNQVQLQFPSENGLVDEFPAGYSIGFALVINGFNNGNVNAGLGTIYTEHSLNTPINDNNNDVQGQRTVALFEPGTNQMIALGFEDYPDWDQDYNDAIFNIFVEEPNAIDTDNMPYLTEPEEDPIAISAVSGILLFEDLWPSKGDYDMNDVVVTYHSTIYRNKNNNIVKVEDVFTPIWEGCELINGFGYEMANVATTQVADVTIDWGEHTPSTYMEGKTSETGQSKQTIILFEDVHEVIPTFKKPYKITTTFVTDAVSDIQPPYNPFIFVNNPDPYVAPGNNGRNHEIHLTNFPPTDLGNTLPFGLADDKSNIEDDLYYISEFKYPFAMDLPYINFRIVKETVNISDAYRYYDGWVESNGEENKDWYEYPTESQVEDPIILD